MRAWKSTGSARSRALASSVIGFAVLVGAAGDVCAQPHKVAVLSVEGPTGDKAKAEILKAIRGLVDLVPDSDWNASAKKLFATTRSAGDLSAIAGDLGVQVVITGKVKKTDEGWELSVGVRHGPTGKSAVKLKYPLKGPRVDTATLQRLAEEVVPALDVAAAGSSGQEPSESAEVPGTPDEMSQPAEEENPLEAMKQKEPEIKGRPSWAPYLDASVGFVTLGRNFSFDEPSTPTFAGSLALGLQIDVTAYPLAFMAQKPGKGNAAAAGLGLGATVGFGFWPDSIPCPPDAQGNCLPSVDRYKTTESRFEAGLRWRWNIARKASRPELLAGLQYGQHAFGVQKRAYLADGGPRDIGPPNVNFSYIAIGLGTRIPFVKRLAVFVQFDWHILTSTGEIQTAESWGVGSGFGFRLNGGLEVRIWKGLFARVTGHFEYYKLAFAPLEMGVKRNTMPPCPCNTIGGATDMFFGGVLSAGYAY